MQTPLPTAVGDSIMHSDSFGKQPDSDPVLSSVVIA